MKFLSSISSPNFLGVGTHSPTSTLDVRGQARVQKLEVRNSANSETHINLFSDAGYGGLSITNGNNWGLIARGEVNVPAVGAYHGGALYIRGFGHNLGISHNNDFNLAKFDFANQRVGIGTDSPTHKLDVSGDANFSGVIEADAGILSRNKIQISQGRLWELIGDTSGFTVRDGSANQNRVFINTSGNVGIGTTSPAARLDFGSSVNQSMHLYTSGSDKYGMSMAIHDSGPYSTNIFSGNNGEIKFRTASNTVTQSTRMTISADGDVGIGTTSPAHKLHVQGTIAQTAVYAAPNDNLNDAVNTRFIRSHTATSNAPVSSFGMGINFEYSSGNSMQILSGRSHGQALYMRKQSNSSWSPWVKIRDDQQITDTHISNWDAGYSKWTGTSGGGDWNNVDSNSFLKGHTTTLNYPPELTHSFLSGIAAMYDSNDGWQLASQRGSDSNLYHRHVQNGTWYGWKRILDTSDIYVNSSNGNIGIGTTSPDAKLEINTTGNGAVALKLNSNATNDLSFNHYSGYSTLRDHSLSNNRMLFFDSGKIAMPYNLGIGYSGSTQPTDTLDVNGTFRTNAIWSTSSAVTHWGVGSSKNAYGGLTWGSGYATVYSTSGKHLHLAANGATPDMSITTVGNVGIGTSTPANKLHVVGITESAGFVNNDVTFKKSFSLGNINIGTYKAVGQLDFGSVYQHHFKVTMSSFGLIKEYDFHGYQNALEKYYKGHKRETNRYENIEPIIETIRNGSNEIIGVKIGIANNSTTQHDYVFTVTVECMSDFESWTDFSHSEAITEETIQLVRYQDLGGNTAFIDQRNGNVGIGTQVPSAKLDVNGTLEVNNEIHFTNNQMRIYRSGDSMRLRTASVDRMQISSNGAVSIGTTSDSHGLVVSTAPSNGRVARLGNLEITTQSATYTGSSIVVTGANSHISYVSTLGHKFVTRTQGGGNTLEALTISPDTGNVGIGATSPADKLHVQGKIRIQRTGYSAQYSTISQELGNLQFNTQNQSYRFFVTGVEKMILTSQGKLGLNSFSPNALFESTPQDASIDSILIGRRDNGSYWRFNHAGNDLRMFNTSGAGHDILFGVDAGSNLIDNKVGIGVTNPSAKLDVGGGNIRRTHDANNYSQMGAGGSGGFIHGYSAGSEKFMIRSYASSGVQAWFTAGNVGIGTNNPQSKLHVSGGDIQIDANKIKLGAGGAYSYIQHNGSNLITFFQSNWGGDFKFRAANNSGTQNDILYIEGANQRVGIGTNTPSDKLHVQGNVRVANDAGIYVFTDSVNPNETEDIFKLRSSHGAQAFRVTFVCNRSGYSVAKTYEVVHSYGAAPVYFKVVDSGPYNGHDFDLEFVDDDNEGIIARLTNNSGSLDTALTTTVFLGGSPTGIIVTEL